MKFAKYPSLTNDYAIGKARRINSTINEDWYSTEKIHGTNGVIGVDIKNKTAIVGGRNGWREDSFYTSLAEMLKTTHSKLIEELLTFDNYDNLYVYGEIYGFGIMTMGYNIITEEKRDFKLFNVIGMKDGRAFVVSRKTIGERISPEYVTRIVEVKTGKELLSNELNRESEYGGTSEGFVYQPYRDEDYELEVNPGIETTTFAEFLGIKHKHEDFGEVSRKQKVKREVSQRELIVADEIERYVTKNRLINVLSHGSELTEKNFGTIIKEMQEDVRTELTRDSELEITEEELNFGMRRTAGPIVKLMKELMSEGF